MVPSKHSLRQLYTPNKQNYSKERHATVVHAENSRTSGRNKRHNSAVTPKLQTAATPCYTITVTLFGCSHRTQQSYTEISHKSKVVQRVLVLEQGLADQLPSAHNTLNATKPHQRITGFFPCDNSGNRTNVRFFA